MGKNNDDTYIKTRVYDTRTFLKNYILVIAIICAMIIFSVINPEFISIENLFTIIRQASITGLLALGLNILVIIGGFDISLGAIANFASVVPIVLVMNDVQNIYLLWAIGILMGIILSMINSIFIVYIGIPPFIVTLSMLSLATALSRALTRGGITMYPEELPAGFTVLGQSNIFHIIPVPVVIFLVSAFIILIIVEYTPFGRRLYAVGSNPDASNHVGIKVKSTQVKAFLITGVLYGIGGIMMSSVFGSCTANVGDAYQMPGIISVFLGASFLSIGHPNIKGTIVSVFLLSVLVNGFSMIGLPFYLRSIIQGLILLVAIGYQLFGKGKYEITTLVDARK
jgi:ribose/xylose/arabinose/galactoside ABC-type transport system permease subunit